MRERESRSRRGRGRNKGDHRLVIAPPPGCSEGHAGPGKVSKSRRGIEPLGKYLGGCQQFLLGAAMAVCPMM